MGPDYPPFVIAEVAQAHDGSLGCAHAYIDLAADVGADAVKFQTHIASEESTPGEPWRIKFSRQDDSRYEYWRRMEFSPEQWAGLKLHAEEKGLYFLSTPFSEAAVDLLESLDVPAWKIGSGEITNYPLLDRVAQTSRPILLSSGMSSWAELDAAVSRIGGPKGVLQCTSKYPCPPESLGLSLIAEMENRYRVPVGLSDHSASIFAGLGAVAVGASIVEAHIVFDRRCFGPDTSSSLTGDEFAQLVQGAKYLFRARSPLDKDEVSTQLAGMRALFEKSVVFKAPLSAGHVVRPEDLAFKKPGTGIPAKEQSTLWGKRLRRDVADDVLVAPEDFEDAA